MVTRILFSPHYMNYALKRLKQSPPINTKCLLITITLRIVHSINHLQNSMTRHSIIILQECIQSKLRLRRRVKENDNYLVVFLNK